MSELQAGDELGVRARRWLRAQQAPFCESEPWRAGRILRSPRFPDMWSVNGVTVEREPQMTVAELGAFARRELRGYPGCSLHIEDTALADALAPALREAGWRTMGQLLLLLAERGPRADRSGIGEVPYEAAETLRRLWREEELPAEAHGAWEEQARAVDRELGARVFTAAEAGRPFGFAQLIRIDSAAEVMDLYVVPDRRGEGVGTRLLSAAIAAVEDAAEIWICADPDGRPRRLYERFGFTPAWRYLRCPPESPEAA